MRTQRKRESDPWFADLFLSCLSGQSQTRQSQDPAFPLVYLTGREPDAWAITVASSGTWAGSLVRREPAGTLGSLLVDQVPGTLLCPKLALAGRLKKNSNNSKQTQISQLPPSVMLHSSSISPDWCGNQDEIADSDFSIQLLVFSKCLYKEELLHSRH